MKRLVVVGSVGLALACASVSGLATEGAPVEPVASTAAAAQEATSSPGERRMRVSVPTVYRTC